MYALKVALVVLTVVALCSSEADPKKSTKKVEKASNKSEKPVVKTEKDSKTQKRGLGLYPEPHLGSTYVVPGESPPVAYHSSPSEHLSVTHDFGVYGGVYSQHLDVHAPVVAATYAPRYGFDGHSGIPSHGDYSSYSHGYLGGFPGGLKGLEALLGGVTIQEGTIRVKTITTHVPVPVPHPVPVEVIKKVPVPVPHPVPVDVPRAVKVEVPQPYPVEVPKPYPVEVPRPVPQLVPHPVHVKVPQPYPVEVPTPYTVEVTKPVPVPVPHTIEIPKPVLYHPAPKSYAPALSHNIHTPSYTVAPTYTPTYATATYRAPTPTYSAAPSHYHPVISVKKCEDDHSYDTYLKSSSVPLPKELFSVSQPSPGSQSYGHRPSYVPSYPNAGPNNYGYHSTPAPAYDYGYIPASSTTHSGATSYVASYGAPSYGGYNSAVHHHPQY